MSMEKNLYRLLLLLCLYIPFENMLEEFFGISAKLVPDILVVLCFAAYSIKIRFRYKLRREDFCLAAFLVLAFISTVFVNRVGLVKFIYEFRCLFLYYAVYVMARDMHYGDEMIARVAFILKGILTVFFVFGVVEKIFNKEVLYFESVSRKIIYADNFQRVYSLVLNPNTYAAFALLAFLVILYDAVRREKNIVGISILTMSTMYLTMSRSASIIGMVLIGAILIAAILKRRVNFKVFLKNAGVIIAGSFLVCSLVIGAGKAYLEMDISSERPGFDENKDKPGEPGDKNIFERLEGSFSIKELDNSQKEGRIFSVLTGLKIFREYPLFGTGFGTYGSAASTRGKPLFYEEYGISEGFYADNQYIALMVETGLLGTLLFAAFVLCIVWKYRKSFWKILFLIFTAWMGIFYNVFELRILMFFIWMLLAFDFSGIDKKESLMVNEK